jgi:hypothetical protein
MLLDCGAHLVLIDTELVTKLGLCHCHLPEPELIDVALKNAEMTEELMLP